MFLRNRWYVAAWDDEVSDKPLARTVLNEPIVLFRGEDGVVTAFEDRCVHRRMPLSLGWVKGNDLQCRYHGLTYDRTGQCIRVPGQDSVGDWARVRAYRVAERHRWVFVWMGDPAAADETLNATGGNLEKDQLAKAMAAVRFAAPRGPFRFDPETHNVIENIYIKEIVKVDGRITDKVMETFTDVRDPGAKL